VTLHALMPHPIPDLPPGVVKRPVDCRVRCFEPLIVRPRVSDEDLMPGKTQIDGDMEAVPVAVMVTRQLDDDVTGDDAVEDVLELLGAKPNMGG
jgi:hypothetical protein